jgi:hypothetical protein
LQRQALILAESGLIFVVVCSQIIVHRAIANTALSLLLLTTLMWGGCVSCEQFFMWRGAKGCCGQNGRCKTKQAPAGERAGAPCTQIAYDHEKSNDHPVSLPVVEVRLEPLSTPVLDHLVRHETAEAAGPAPPDLLVLHSTFLI